MQRYAVESRRIRRTEKDLEETHMEVVATIIKIALVIIAVLLIVVVLLQKTKSSGMGSAFGSDTASFTAKGKAASKEAKLQKLTIWLGAALGVLAILLTIFS